MSLELSTFLVPIHLGYFGDSGDYWVARSYLQYRRRDHQESKRRRVYQNSRVNLNLTSKKLKDNVLWHFPIGFDLNRKNMIICHLAKFLFFFYLLYLCIISRIFVKKSKWYLWYNFFSHFFDMVLFLTIIFSAPKSSINSLWSYIFISVRNYQLYLNIIPIIPKKIFKIV